MYIHDFFVVIIISWKYFHYENLRKKWMYACGISKTRKVDKVSIFPTHFVPEHIEPPNLKFNMRTHLKLGEIPSIGVPNPIESTVETTIKAPPAMNVPSLVVKYVIDDNDATSNENLDSINYIYNIYNCILN